MSRILQNSLCERAFNRHLIYFCLSYTFSIIEVMLVSNAIGKFRRFLLTIFRLIAQDCSKVMRNLRSVSINCLLDLTGAV